MPEWVMTMQISLPPARYASESSRRAFYSAVLDRIRQVPGVMDASGCSVLPFGNGENMEPFALAGQAKGTLQQLASVNYVTPSYLKTLRIPLLDGHLIKPVAVAMSTLPSLIGILPAATFAVRIPWNRSCKWVIGFLRSPA